MYFQVYVSARSETTYLPGFARSEMISTFGNDIVHRNSTAKSGLKIILHTNYVPPLSTSVNNLKSGINEALKIIDPDMLVRVCQEMEYRFHVCHVTKGSYIEHL